MRGWGEDSHWGSPRGEPDHADDAAAAPGPGAVATVEACHPARVSSATVPERAACGQAMDRHGAGSLGPSTGAQHCPTAVALVCQVCWPEELGLTVSALPLVSPCRAGGPSRNFLPAATQPKVPARHGRSLSGHREGLGGPSANTELVQRLSAPAATLE